MRYERLWERLLDFLNGWSTAAEIEPGRIEVAVESPGGSTRVVAIVMTHDQWDDMVTVAFGDFDLAANEVRQAVLGRGDEERFLVYGTYELVASTTPGLPPDPDLARLEELARLHPEGCGHWLVTDRDGNVSDEFRPPPD